MPYYRVTVRGDPARGAGLLAKAGIQNLVAEEGVTARLVAENGEGALQRVRTALEGEEFTIAEAQPESQQAAPPRSRCDVSAGVSAASSDWQSNL